MALHADNIGKELLVAIKDGDTSAFEAFYRMERNNLVHFVSQYSVPAATAEDIAQETLMKIWETRSRLDAEGNLRALTFTIARNKTLDYLRTRVDSTSLDACSNLEDESLDSLINALDLTSLVVKTFESLPAKTRITFLMSRHKGLTYREIARKEKISTKAVEHRISSALKSLKKIKESL